MAKLKAPLLSFGARGKIAGSLVYYPWKGIDCAREYVIPANPKSTLQIAQRAHFDNSVAAWHSNEYTDADRIAWNQYAGTLAQVMSGFNAMMRLAIAIYRGLSSWRQCAQVEVDTPTAVGFDVDIERGVQGQSFRARIGTSRTHYPVTVALVDDADDTFSLTWAAGQTDTDYYVYLEVDIVGWKRCTGIYHVRTT